MYEYVKKSEYAPVRKELEEIIKSVQIEMREKYKLSFQFQLIGSGRRHLVTRIRGGNSGYDFDYNLIIQRWGNMQRNPQIVKQSFMDALKKALRGTPYSFPKDSTSAITIKVVDKKQKKICHSCDFAIIYYKSSDVNNGFYYLKNNKERNRYEFVYRSINFGIRELQIQWRHYQNDFYSKKITNVFLLLAWMWMLSGCSLLSEKKYEEDVSLKIVKSGVKIEESRFDSDLGIDGKEIYKFTIPIEITGTFQHDCTIPVYYYFDMERNRAELDKEASAWATEGQFKSVFKGEVEIKKGTTGIVYYEGETDDALMNPDSTPYEQAWVAFRYDDGFIPDNYAGIFNPFFDEEKYPDSEKVQSAYERVRDITPQETVGNVYIDEESIEIEKTYIGEEPGNPQHYTVSVTVQNDSDNPIATEELWIGCDYDMASPFNSHNCFEALGEALTFMDGFGGCLGYTVQQKSITKEEDSVRIEFDMYNRYAGYSDSLMGNDLDWYQCFWIAICLKDDNRNDNYVMVPNPYFNEAHYSDEVFWREHEVNDIYRYGSADTWNDLFWDGG